MLVKEPLDFAKEFIKSVNQYIEKEKPGRRMQHHQQWWLAFCITSVVLTGRCNGNTLYGSLYIDQLWVTESLRNIGYGAELINAAEQFGKDKGCTFATVNTMDWEALEFYKKMGYGIEFERHGYSKNSTFYFLRKSLPTAGDAP